MLGTTVVGGFAALSNGTILKLNLHSVAQRASMGLFSSEQDRLLRATRQDWTERKQRADGRIKTTAKRIKVARN
jgi:hypothetical protein